MPGVEFWHIGCGTFALFWSSVYLEHCDLVSLVVAFSVTFASSFAVRPTPKGAKLKDEHYDKPLPSIPQQAEADEDCSSASSEFERIEAGSVFVSKAEPVNLDADMAEFDFVPTSAKELVDPQTEELVPVSDKPSAADDEHATVEAVQVNQVERDDSEMCDDSVVEVNGQPDEKGQEACEVSQDDAHLTESIGSFVPTIPATEIEKVADEGKSTTFEAEIDFVTSSPEPQPVGDLPLLNGATVDTDNTEVVSHSPMDDKDGHVSPGDPIDKKEDTQSSSSDSSDSEVENGPMESFAPTVDSLIDMSEPSEPLCSRLSCERSSTEVAESHNLATDDSEPTTETAQIDSVDVANKLTTGNKLGAKIELTESQVDSCQDQLTAGYDDLLARFVDSEQSETARNDAKALANCSVDDKAAELIAMQVLDESRTEESVIKQETVNNSLSDVNVGNNFDPLASLTTGTNSRPASGGQNRLDELLGQEVVTNSTLDLLSDAVSDLASYKEDESASQLAAKQAVLVEDNTQSNGSI